VKYAFIDEHRSAFPVKSLCRELDISRSLYYAVKKGQPSLSRRCNCWDNAVAESFFSNLKNEAMHDQLFSSRAEGKAVVGDYIETYYNQQRLHQTLGYQTPAAVEAALRVPK
jgi:transposase InsO family protein